MRNPERTPLRLDTLPPRRRAWAATLREARRDLATLVDLAQADFLDEWDNLESTLLEEWDRVEEAAEEALVRARRIVLLVVGATLLLLGAALVVTPIPGTPVVLAGLTLLATEFAWARRWRLRIERTAARALRTLKEEFGLD